MSGRAYGNSYVRAPTTQVTLSSLATLVSSLKQQQEVQSTEIERIKSRVQRLEKENEDLRAENNDLWNEINKIKGPKFPPELCDRIIDFLHHDHKGLKACSLVCRAWIPASRFHLFECINYEVASSSSQAMVDLLDSSFCTLFKHVREITISGSTDLGHPDGPMIGFPVSWLQPLAQYLNRFTSITALRLQSMSTTSIRYIIDSPSFTSRITNLSLYKIICFTFNDLPYILSYFSKLESLDCSVHCCDISGDDCTCPMYIADMHVEALAIDDSPSPPPATLRVLSVDDNVSSCYPAVRTALYNWLRVGGHPNLQTLLLGFLEFRDEVKTLSSYLHGSGATLKYISLGFETEEAIDIFSAEFEALSGCISLETLHIWRGIWSYEMTQKKFHRSLVKLPKLLLSLPIASMKKLTFNISSPWSPLPKSEQLSNLYSFAAIDQLLHRFSVLEEITFKMDKVQGELPHVLRSKLPKCEKKGVLRMCDIRY